MRDNTSRRAFLGSVVGAFGAVAGIGLSIGSSDPSEQSDSAAPVPSEGDDTPRWITARHLRHYDGGRYGMIGLGRTTLLNRLVARRAEVDWSQTDLTGDDNVLG